MLINGQGDYKLKGFIELLADRKLIVFGTGELARKFVSELDKGTIAFFLDNNPEKQKQIFMGKHVNSSSTIINEHKEEIFIVVASMYYEEIKKQLAGLGLIEGVNFEHCDYIRNYIEFMGDDFICPFCQKSFRHFLPTGIKADIFENNQILGGGYRENAVCPRCSSLDRERHLYLYLKEKTDIFNSKRKVLHIAPESNLKVELDKNKEMEYLCGDLYPPEGKGIIKLDVTDLPFKDSYFDVIICNHVLEHVPDDRRAMGELFRVLKTGGWAILQVPISDSLDKTYEDSNIVTPEERLEKFGHSDHVRLYGKDYFKRLEEAGFHIELYNYFKEHGSNMADKYGLLKDENIFICYK